ncbi:methyl-accepting chemotaxis protein [Brevibacillus fluminis]|uniref:methyl-accepting chemotaxis protein n=1 Tax=Brevibacillus fluminis TaxID=511487 RepID=UPI003F89971E
MSIAKKITITFTIILVMFAALGSYLYIESLNQSETTTTMESRTLRSALLAEEMKLSVVQVQQWWTDISATRGKNGLNDGMEKAKTYADLFQKQLAEMKRLNPEDEGRLQEMESAFQTYYETGQTMARAFIEGGYDAGNRYMGDFDKRAETINQEMDVFRKEKMDGITGAVSDIQDSIEMSNQLIILFFVVVLSTAGFLSIWLSRSIVRPLRSLSQTAMVISQGKLNQAVAVHSQDEVGQLAHSFEQMRENLHMLIQGVKETADELAMAAGQLSEGAEQTAESSKQIAESVQEIAEGAKRQLDRSEESAHSMREMNGGIEMVAASSSSVADLSSAMSSLAKEGNEAVTKAADQMGQIDLTFQQTDALVQQLDTCTAKIVEILRVMNAITSQTQVLALNASIEAARAGEHGKGFAIVAEEVRKLAGESQESSARIADLVDDLRSNMATVVTSMKQSSHETQSGIEVVNEANTIFATIRHTIVQVNDQIQEVSASAEQMSSNTEQMNDAVLLMKQIAERAFSKATSAVHSVNNQLVSAEEVARSADRLNREAIRLQGMVSRFEV